MTYHDFKENTQHIIQNRLGADARVTIHEVVKNNDTRLDGLSVLSGGANASPTVYLNYYYRQYLNGRSMDDIYREILTIFEQNPHTDIDVSFFTDYEKAKHRIVFRLVNYERNRPLLDKVPHIRFLDLAIVFHCLVEAGGSECATILIYNHHLAFWDITKEELYACAQKNTPQLLACELRDMSEVLSGFLADSDGNVQDITEKLPAPMYVLTNQNRLNGSGCILYRNLLKTVSAKLGGDLYVIPSSVHEVLIIPAKGSDADTLSDIVKEVNRTQLTREEILSDHVYFYSMHTGEISVPAGY